MSTLLIDYGAGNLRSVANALQSLGVTPTIISSGDTLPACADRIILPGVGAFGDSMVQLNQRNLTLPLIQLIEQNIPFLGICVGYQLLFESSEESPEVKGLSLLKGQVRRFRPGKKIPHMGWNSVQLSDPAHDLWKDQDVDPYFYYVHSYYPVPEDEKIIAAKTDYAGETFAAGIIHKNIHAVQFHPEKSQHAGLNLLKQFLSMK